MRKLTTIAILVAAGVSTAAIAAPQQNAQPLHWYASLGAGMASTAPIDYANISGSGGSGSLDLTQNFKTGSSTNFAVGIKHKQLRAEFELGVVHNQTDNVNYALSSNGKSISASPSDSGSMTVVPVMLNGYYDFAVSPKISLYAGLGLGVASVSSSFKVSVPTGNGDKQDHDNDKASSTPFAYQLMLGGAYHFNSTWSLGTEVRYLATAKFNEKTTVYNSKNVNQGSFKTSTNMHTVETNLVLSYNFS